MFQNSCTVVRSGTLSGRTIRKPSQTASVAKNRIGVQRIKEHIGLVGDYVSPAAGFHGVSETWADW